MQPAWHSLNVPKAAVAVQNGSPFDSEALLAKQGAGRSRGFFGHFVLETVSSGWSRRPGVSPSGDPSYARNRFRMGQCPLKEKKNGSFKLLPQSPRSRLVGESEVHLPADAHPEGHRLRQRDGRQAAACTQGRQESPMMCVWGEAMNASTAIQALSRPALVMISF